MCTKPNYDIVLSEESLNQLISYKNDLHTHRVETDFYLKDILAKINTNLDQINTEKFIELLLLTKKPIIFAESEIKG